MREQHIKLWTWLAENPGKSKRDWPGWYSLGITNYTNDRWYNRCFACAAVWHNGRPGCQKCPIKWTDKRSDEQRELDAANPQPCVVCELSSAEYHKWMNARDSGNVTIEVAIALKIAQMWPEE